MSWKKYDPNFEFSDEVFSAWWGHIYFGYDLVRNIEPKKIVELGTHNGVSFFSFCQAVKDGNLNTELNAVDTWKGDEHAGFHDEGVYVDVKTNVEKYFSDVKVNLLKKTFDDASGDFSDGSIDILHIDGLHTYESVKHDFYTWIDKVSDNGIILFHDIHEKRDDFGVHQLWKELKKEYRTIEFYHWHGLGVLLKNSSRDIFENQDEVIGYYTGLSDNFSFSKLSRKKRQIEVMENSFFWKLREKYLSVKSKFSL